MANYISNKELLIEIKKSKENNELTGKALEMLQKMVRETNRVMRYKNQMDREDCISRALLDILLYWRSFNPDHPKANAFSYFTQMIKYGNAKGFNELYPENKNNIKFVSINETDGIYNI